MLPRIVKRRLDNSGIAYMEFALIAPVLLLLLCGTMEFSMLMFANSVLESATNVSSRLGKTGYTEDGVSREQMIHDLIKEKGQGLLNPDLVEISTLSYSHFADIGDPEPFQDTNNNGQHDEGEQYDDINVNGQWDEDMGQTGLGNAGDIVLYKVSYPWNIVTPLISKFFGESGIYEMTSAVVVKNEPYN